MPRHSSAHHSENMSHAISGSRSDVHNVISIQASVTQNQLHSERKAHLGNPTQRQVDVVDDLRRPLFRWTLCLVVLQDGNPAEKIVVKCHLAPLTVVVVDGDIEVELQILEVLDERPASRQCTRSSTTSQPRKHLISVIDIILFTRARN